MSACCLQLHRAHHHAQFMLSHHAPSCYNVFWIIWSVWLTNIVKDWSPAAVVKTITTKMFFKPTLDIVRQQHHEKFTFGLFKIYSKLKLNIFRTINKQISCQIKCEKCNYWKRVRKLLWRLIVKKLAYNKVISGKWNCVTKDPFRHGQTWPWNWAENISTTTGAYNNDIKKQNLYLSPKWCLRVFRVDLHFWPFRLVLAEKNTWLLQTRCWFLWQHFLLLQIALHTSETSIQRL